MSKLTDGAVLKVQWGLKVFRASFYPAKKNMKTKIQLPQRRPGDIWRRKYYPKPFGLEISTLISVVSPSKMVGFFFSLSFVQCWAKTMGRCCGSSTKLLFGRDPAWKPLVSRVWGQMCTNTFVARRKTHSVCDPIHHPLLFNHQTLFGQHLLFYLFFVPC